MLSSSKLKAIAVACWAALVHCQFDHYLQAVKTEVVSLRSSKDFELLEEYSYVAYSAELQSEEVPVAKFQYEVSPMSPGACERDFGILLSFLTNFCAIIGGVFTVAGIIDLVLHNSIRMGKEVELEICEQKVKKYLLLVAHPDDECMFFGPTLLSLIMLGGCEFHVLCISNGNADGLGACRTLEMLSSCSVFKVPPENVRVLDHPSLQDGHRQHWNQQLLVQIIAETVESQAVDWVITFDKYGVSGHPNHCALSQALRAYLAERSKGSIEDGPIEGWELESVNIGRKYSGMLEIFVSTLKWWLNRKKGDCLCFVTPNPLISVEAMKQHRSQWLWYRRLFVVFSSYTYVNTLRRIPVKREVKKHN